MKNYKRVKVISIGLISIISLYIAIGNYINQGLFRDKVINKYVNSQVTKIKITRTSDDFKIVIEDVDKIAGLMNSLSNLEINKYKKEINWSSEVYDLAIYEGTDIKLGLTIYDNEYITFLDLIGGNSSTYKIINENYRIAINEYVQN